MARKYIRRIFPHDLTHEVSITQHVHIFFFHSKYYLTFVKGKASTQYYVTVNDATDLRFGGDFKSMLPYLEVDDFICIEDCGEYYSLSIIKKGTSTAKDLFLELSSKQRHLILSNDNVIYKA